HAPGERPEPRPQPGAKHHSRDRRHGRGDYLGMDPAAPLRAFYFLYYGYVGTFQPHFAAYLRGLGWSGEQIGVVQTLPSFLAPAVAMTWAAWADRIGNPVRALRRATLVAGTAALALPFARTPLVLGAILVAQALGERAVIPLVDAVTLDWARREPSRSYARIRLFGSLGFVVLAIAVGALLAARGDRPADPLVPVTIAACVVLYALLARRLPRSTMVGDRPGPRDLAALLRDRRLLALLAACALHWAACAPYHLFFGVLVRDLGLSANVTGLGMGVGVAGELLALVAFPRLVARFSTRTLFAAAFLGSAVRWVLVARIASAEALVAVQLLHGLTFGVFWGTAMHALAGAVPPRVRATGTALFAAVVFGGGNGAGYLLSGLGYDRLGGAGPLFAAAAAVELLALAVALARSSRPVPA
ncbi:MAG TPA: MFS transporter, partial [Anaeromyxobacteraceae bacterium]|nr:MFS transporter [Anaeromyxobacteraceae bacterium]